MTRRVFGFGIHFGDESQTVAFVGCGDGAPRLCNIDDLPPTLQIDWIDPPRDEDVRIREYEVAQETALALGRLSGV